MPQGRCQTPLQWLQHLETCCLEQAHGLPQQEQAEDEWLGIGFRLGELQLVAPLEEVAEILTPPPMSRIPRTKSWVCGIANVRGNLLPVMDLQAYLHDKTAMLGRRSRILVVNHEGVYSGLGVDAVLGLKHFTPEQRCQVLPEGSEFLGDYLTHGYRNSQGHWGVFSMHKLAGSPQFLQAAV